MHREATRGLARRRPTALGCDSIVALGAASATGATLFGKNSDRPPDESQPLLLVPAATHPPGARLACQWIEIPQARETARVLGSRPHWLWGFEHGVNEHGVAIGNETVFTRVAPSSTGLVGMDLVRLGLERATSATGAIETIASLLEEHGQGGSGFRDVDFPYHSSFLVADPREAWILETAGCLWAARRARDVDSISNHLSIGADWDRISPDAEATAIGAGWWSAGRLDFAAAYRDLDALPPVFSEGRLARSRTLLGERLGALEVADLKSILRDHAGLARCTDPDVTPDREEFYTVCMHRGPSRTTASLVAELDPDPAGPRVVRVALGRPCASVYFPLVVAGELPASLSAAGDEGGLWWVFESIAAVAEADVAAAAHVGETFAALEADLEASLADAMPSLRGDASGAAASEFMRAIAARIDDVARDLRSRLSA